MRHLLSIILCILSIQSIYAQVEPSITLDPSTGNYIIRYTGYEGQVQEVMFEPATKIDPYVDAKVSFKQNSGDYQYEYVVKNGINSQQRLLHLYVDLSSSIDSIQDPNNEWRSGIFYYRPTVNWGHTMARPDGMRSPRSGIAPDSSVSGFSYKSFGLPTIVMCYFGGAAPGFGFPDEPPGEVDLLLDPLIRFPANTVQRKTLGPKDPPDPFIPTAFLDTLIYYTQKSLKLGWITDQSTSDKYGSYFKTSQTQLQQDNISVARNTLGLVLQDVAQDSGDILSSEAYSLLRYNTEYLISQLVEEEVTIDDLIVYITQAYENGSIDNKGIANSLISKLETAKKQLEKEKTKQAVNALNAFLNELEAQKEKHVNIDIYEYLKENVEALVEQLSGG